MGLGAAFGPQIGVPATGAGHAVAAHRSRCAELRRLPKTSAHPANQPRPQPRETHERGIGNGVHQQIFPRFIFVPP